MASDKADLISSVIFSEVFGIIMTFFSGQFKMFEPIKFKQTWHQETADQADSQEDKGKKSLKDKKNSFSMGCKNIPIV